MGPSSFRTSTRRFGAIVIAMALTMAMIATPAAADVSFINSRRADAGLPAVRDSGALASVAAAHSREMAERGSLFHSSGLGSKVASAIGSYEAAGENVGVGSSLSAVNSMFMQSATHRANILGNYNVAGVGVFTGGDGQVWVTQIFARAAGAAAPAPAPAPTRTATTLAAASVAPRPSAPRVSRSAPRSVPVRPQVEPARPDPAAVGGFAMGDGYVLVADDGGVFTYDGATFAGSAAGAALNAPVVGASPTHSGNGYVLFSRDGGVFAFGDAQFIGSLGDVPLNAPVIGGAMSPSGAGYHLFSGDGGVFTFGDARFAGSLGGVPLNAAVVGGSLTPTGRGYVLVSSDGGVFAFGDARFFGSLGGSPLNAPIVGVAMTPTGEGYWLVAADGGVFAFGDAVYFGGLAGAAGAGDDGGGVRAIIAAPSGQGYWLVGADKQVTGFGDVDAPGRRQPWMGPGIRLI